MKITAVKIHHYEWERTPFHWRDGIMPGGAKTGGALLQIDTDQGVSGFSPRAGGDIEEIKFQLIGQYGERDDSTDSSTGTTTINGHKGYLVGLAYRQTKQFYYYGG